MIRSRRALRALALGCAVLAGQARGGEPGVAEAMRTADALLSTGNAAAAEAVLEEVVATAPADPAPYNQLAILLARRGELERARDLLDAALRTHPAYADVYANLQAVLGALAARAYARALDDADASATALELASISPGLRAEAHRGSIPTVVTRVPAVPVPALAGPLPTEPLLARTAPMESVPAEPGPVQPAPAEPALAAAPRVEPVSEAVPRSPVTTALSDEARAVETARVRDRVRAWARAWSAQDVDTYLSFYSERFRPSRGLSREAWRAQRRRRVGRPDYIEVDVDAVEIEVDGTGYARARFEQSYRSDRLRSTVDKVLELALDAGEWRIVRETVR